MRALLGTGIAHSSIMRLSESSMDKLYDLMTTGNQREFFIDNLLVRNHFIIVMIRWTGLAPLEFEFPFPGSLASTLRVRPFSSQFKNNYFAEM